MWLRSELKAHAKEVLKLNYWRIVLAALIMAFLTGSIGSGRGTASFRDTFSGSFDESSFQEFISQNIAAVAAFIAAFAVIFIAALIVSLLLSVFLLNPLVAGGQRFFIKSLKGSAEIREFTYVFSHAYLNVVKTMFLRSLYIFLWSLLFLIPGIIKAYEYMMVPYILAETPEMDSKEVFARSRAMMNGDKWNAFVLDLSFLGWQILGSLTFGILNIFYVNPYYHLTFAELYAVLRQKVDGPDAGRNPYTMY